MFRSLFHQKYVYAYKWEFKIIYCITYAKWELILLRHVVRHVVDKQQINNMVSNSETSNGLCGIARNSCELCYQWRYLLSIVTKMGIIHTTQTHRWWVVLATWPGDHRGKPSAPSLSELQWWHLPDEIRLKSAFFVERKWCHSILRTIGNSPRRSFIGGNPTL